MAHAADGTLHPVIVVAEHESITRGAPKDALGRMVGLARGLGGALTGEHGVGLLQRDRFTAEVGEVPRDLQHRIKRAFDPHSTLNPGKAVRPRPPPPRCGAGRRPTGGSPGRDRRRCRRIRETEGMDATCPADDGAHDEPGPGPRRRAAGGTPAEDGGRARWPGERPRGHPDGPGATRRGPAPHGGRRRGPPLEQRRLTYPEVGATAGALPVGYDHLVRSRAVGAGEAAFRAAAERLMGWEMHRSAGFEVRPTAARAALGTRVVLRLGRGPLRLEAPCEVVRVLDEPRRQGFAYGTLEGHPERGEELFCLDLRPDGTVVLSITAFSRPAAWWARAGAAPARWAQERVTQRYLRALL